jgi:hypothetical protein
MYVGEQALPSDIHFLVKFRIWKIHNVLDIKLIFLKLWIFTNFNTVFPVVVLVFDFEEFSEGVLHGHLDWWVLVRAATMFWSRHPRQKTAISVIIWYIQSTRTWLSAVFLQSCRVKHTCLYVNTFFVITSFWLVDLSVCPFVCSSFFTHEWRNKAMWRHP